MVIDRQKGCIFSLYVVLSEYVFLCRAVIFTDILVTNATFFDQMDQFGPFACFHVVLGLVSQNLI